MPAKLAKHCDYTNCRKFYTRTVGMMRLCNEHAAEFRKFLNHMFTEDKNEQEDPQNHG